MVHEGLATIAPEAVAAQPSFIEYFWDVPIKMGGRRTTLGQLFEMCPHKDNPLIMTKDARECYSAKILASSEEPIAIPEQYQERFAYCLEELPKLRSKQQSQESKQTEVRETPLHVKVEIRLPQEVPVKREMPEAEKMPPAMRVQEEVSVAVLPDALLPAPTAAKSKPLSALSPLTIKEKTKEAYLQDAQPEVFLPEVVVPPEVAGPSVSGDLLLLSMAEAGAEEVVEDDTDFRIELHALFTELGWLEPVPEAEFSETPALEPLHPIEVVGQELAERIEALDDAELAVVVPMVGQVFDAVYHLQLLQQEVTPAEDIEIAYQTLEAACQELLTYLHIEYDEQLLRHFVCRLLQVPALPEWVSTRVQLVEEGTHERQGDQVHLLKQILAMIRQQFAKIRQTLGGLATAFLLPDPGLAA